MGVSTRIGARPRRTMAAVTTSILDLGLPGPRVVRDRVRSAIRLSPRCVICGARTRILTVRQDTANVRGGAPGKILRMFPCRVCGFVRNPENVYDPRAVGPGGERSSAAGGGRLDPPGRESHGAQRALATRGRAALAVLVWGGGGSLDNRHIAALPEVR